MRSVLALATLLHVVVRAELVVSTAQDATLADWDMLPELPMVDGLGEALRFSKDFMSKDAVLAEVAKDITTPHKPGFMVSILSEDYREGGSSGHNAVDYYMRHQDTNSLALTTISGPYDMQDASFRVQPALCKPEDDGCPEDTMGSGCVSLMSANFQGHYLQYSEGAISLAKGDGTAAMRVAQSFCLKDALDSNSETGISLQPAGNASAYLKHEGYHFVAGEASNSGAATFRMLPALFHGLCAGPEDPLQCTCHPGYLGELCDQQCPAFVIEDGVTSVCSGHGNCALDPSIRQPVCECRDGYVGKTCSGACPISDDNDEVCHGKGVCTETSVTSHSPDTAITGAACECEPGYLGQACHLACPGLNANCSSHGQCVLHAEIEAATCNCEGGFVGRDCSDECMKNDAGVICSGHGQCAQSDMSAGGTQCDCAEGWVGVLCSRECPVAADGSVCGGSTKGECEDPNGNRAVCACLPGFTGDACEESVGDD